MNEKQETVSGRGIALADPAAFVFLFQEPVEGMAPAEAEEAARLAFEEQSPFPPESIRVGVVRDEGGRIGVFGCEASRVPEVGADGFVVPAFFPFLGWEREPGAVEVADTGDGFAALFFTEGGRVPTEVIGFSAGEDGTPPWDRVGEAADYLGLPWPGPEATPVLRIDAVGCDSRGRFTARIQGGEGGDRNWATGSDELWRADLRQDDEIAQVRAEKVSGERIWTATRIAAGLLAFLVVAQALLWVFGFWVGAREERLRSQAVEVTAVEERAALASRLQDLGKSRLSVFRRLGELNLLRPGGVQFLAVEFDEPDLFQVEGRVSEVRILNDYIRKLEADPRFLISEAPTPRSRDGRLEFELGVRVSAAPPLPTGQMSAAVRTEAGGGS